MWDQNTFIKTLDYAATVHKGQEFPGKGYCYVVHFVQVAQEVMAVLCSAGTELEVDCTLAVQCALLHDTIEDAGVTYDEIEDRFGKSVADGVMALTKNDHLPKEAQMIDSIRRIQKQPREIWMVKLADRIVNLQEPPHYWNSEKIQAYKEEAKLILTELGAGCEALSKRLEDQILKYPHKL